MMVEMSPLQVIWHLTKWTKSETRKKNKNDNSMLPSESTSIRSHPYWQSSTENNDNGGEKYYKK